MAQFTIYRSGDSGAPVLAGTTGALITVLDAVLVNGWTASVTSITRSGTTATVTTATNHGLNTGNSTTISGATQTDYNITAVVTVLTATTFTYTVANSPATPATGTILWKKLGAGWTKSFSGSSKASYRQASGSNQFYVRVQDDGPGVGTFKEARILGYEAMSTVDAGTNPFPTVAQAANGLFVRKSTTADATARSWIIVADDRTFYLFFATGDTANHYFGVMFGDIYSYVNSDSYRTMLIANSSENSATTCTLGSVVTQVISAGGLGHFIARGYLGTGTAVNVSKHTDTAKNAGAGGMAITAAIAYPNAPDGGLYVAPLWVQDIVTAGLATVRGTLRGFWCPLHVSTLLTDQDTFNGTGDAAGKTFLIIRILNVIGNVGACAIETSATLQTN